MRYSTTLIVAAITIGESMAGPTHAHLHRHALAHAKKDAVNWDSLNWNDMGIDWSSAWAAGQHTKTSSASPAPTPTSGPIIAAAKPVTTTSAAPVPTSTSSAAPKASSVASTIESDVKTLFSSIKGLADDLTSFGTPTVGSGSIVGKIGNIGSPQGSNMLKVDSVGSNKYTNTFINTSNKPMTIVLWNKAFERDGVTDANLGSCLAPTSPALSITLAPNAQQIVAFQEDTQMGFSQAVSDTAISGQFATTWGEVNYVSTGCGYDVSAIMNVHGNTYDMTISALETPCISDMTQNLWIARNNNPEDPIPVGDSDGSCFIPAGTCTLTTKMGGQQ